MRLRRVGGNGRAVEQFSLPVVAASQEAAQIFDLLYSDSVEVNSRLGNSQATLTERKMEVLEYLRCGDCGKQSATKLAISECILEAFTCFKSCIFVLSTFCSRSLSR